MISRSQLTALAAAFCAFTSADAQPADAASSLDTATIARRVDSLFTRVTRPDGPGCAVGVYRGGDVILTRGYGLANVEDRRPITRQTTFNLGSVSKPFTALAALMLEQQGKLSLDDDVRRWIPEMPSYGTPIRVRDLLHHTSGLRDYGGLNALRGREVETMPEFLGLLAAQRRLNFTTGSQHEYSHSDFVLLALIVERIAGVPFADHLARAVLEPMGMRGSFVHDGRARPAADRAVGHTVLASGNRIRFPGSEIVGGTNLYASVSDLSSWASHFDRPNVGGAEAMKRMLSRPTLASGDTVPYAYGLRLGTYRGLRTVSRGGHEDAMTSEIIRFPGHGLTVATLCNADHLQAGQLAHSVADLYLGEHMRPGRPRPVAPAPVALPPNDLRRYAGVYMPPGSPWYALPIEVRNGSLVEVLFHETRDDTAIVMTPAGDGRFYEIGLTGNVGVFQFRTDPGGVADRVEISWNDEPAGTGDRVPDDRLWRPSAAALSEYSGTWFSDEMDTAWRFERRGQRLVLRRQGQPDLTLRPISRDRFIRGFGSWVEPLVAEIRFHRNGAGRLTHFTVSTPPGQDSVRGLRFARVAGP